MANNFVAGLPIIVQAFTFDQVTANGSQTVDGVVTIDGEIYFVGGASAATTGVYKASDAGAWELILNSDSSTNNHFLAGQEIIALDGLTNKHVFFKANIDNAGNSLIENVQSPVKKAVEVTSSVTVTNDDSLSIYFVKSSSGNPQILITLPDVTAINDSFSLSLYIAEDNQPIQLLPHATQQFYRNGVLVNSFNISGVGSTINISVAQDGNLLVSGYSQASESELGVLAIAAVADMDTANDTKAVTPSKLKGELDPVKSDVTTAQGDITTLQTQVADKIDTTEKGANNGVATLDATGRVPSSQLPTTSIEYKGSWNASTNTPTLTNGSGTNGDLYVCTVAGTVNFGAGAITFNSGDQALYNGETNEYGRVPVGSVSAETIDTDSWFTQSAFAANQYTITSASGTDPTSNYDGLRFSFPAQNANSGATNNGACTLKIGGNAVLPLRDSGRELVEGDILAGTVLSGVVSGGVAHVIKKETIIFNDENGMTNIKTFDGKTLSLINYQQFRSPSISEPYQISQFDDKKILYVGGTELVLPDFSTVSDNFSVKIFLAASSSGLLTITRTPTTFATLNGLGQGTGSPITIGMYNTAGSVLHIYKTSNNSCQIQVIQRATTANAGLVRIAQPDSETAGFVHDAANVVNKTGVQTGISGDKTFSGSIIAPNIQYTPATNSIYGAATSIKTSLDNLNDLNPFAGSVGWVSSSAASGGDGSFLKPFNTIQAALNNAGSGGEAVYYVAAGTYTENLTFPAGVITKLIAIGSEPESFGGSLSTVEVDGTVNITTGAHIVDGIKFTNPPTLNDTGTTLDAFHNCTLDNGYVVTGASDTNLVFMNCNIKGQIVHDSSINTFAVHYENCIGDLNSEMTCATDTGLIYIKSCARFHYIDCAGAAGVGCGTFYTDGLQSIGKHPVSNVSIRYRGQGGGAGAGYFTLAGNVSLLLDATAILDIDTNTLVDGGGVLYNTAAPNVINAVTKIAPTPL